MNNKEIHRLKCIYGIPIRNINLKIIFNNNYETFLIEFELPHIEF